MSLVVDIIFLSYSKTEELKNTTKNAISSLLNSEKSNRITFNIVVIESEMSLKPFQFANTETIYPNTTFNFHKYLNIGLHHTSGDYICFCNNDLIFHPHWCSDLINALQDNPQLVSVSPICSILHPTLGIYANTGIYEGYEIRKYICGWCFLVKREIFKTISDFDEHFSFWFADQDYSKTLQKHSLKHALVSSSIVDHLDGISTKELNAKTKKAMTTDKFWYFQYKWEHKNIFLYYWRLFRSKTNFGT